MDDPVPPAWTQGAAPVAVVMISLNEGHYLEEVLGNLQGWAQEVFLVDSYSTDRTVDIALEHGVHVVQRRFRGFGDQWNFALNELPIRAPWTMKLDPDERLTPELKDSILSLVRAQEPSYEGIVLRRRLFMMGTRLPVDQSLLRVWKTGVGRFSDVAVNEHALVDGETIDADGELEHHDSPDLEHWMAKQNRYSSDEAISRYRGDALSAQPKLLGNALERRMWLKVWFWKVPFRYVFIYLYHLVALGAWRAGRVGFIWSQLRTDVFRMQEYKHYEIGLAGRLPMRGNAGPGKPDARVAQAD